MGNDKVPSKEILYRFFAGKEVPSKEKLYRFFAGREATAGENTSNLLLCHINARCNGGRILIHETENDLYFFQLK